MFARFLADGLGEQFTADMATAWQTAAAAILAVVEARMKEQLIAQSAPPSESQTSVSGPQSRLALFSSALYSSVSELRAGPCRQELKNSGSSWPGQPHSPFARPLWFKQEFVPDKMKIQ